MEAPKPPPPQSRPRRRLRFVLIGLFTLLLASGLYWRKTVLQLRENLLRSDLIEYQLRKIEKRLPFEIEKIEVRKTWRELLTGRISRLDLILRRGPLRVRLSGGVRLEAARENGEHLVRYEPTASLEIGSQRSPEFPLELWIGARKNFTGLSDFGIKLDRPAFHWPAFGITLEKVRFETGWRDGRLVSLAQVASAEWSAKNPERTVHATRIRVASSTPLEFQPLTVGPGVSLDFSAEGSEILWGKSYFDLPLARLPLHAELDLGSLSGSLSLGPDLTLAFQNTKPEGGHPRKISLDWRTKPVPLQGLIPAILAIAPGQIPGAETLQQLEVGGGTLESRGKMTLSGGTPTDWAGSAALKKLRLRWPKQKLAVRGLSLNAEFSSRKGVDGTVSAEEVFYRRARASLQPTEFFVHPPAKGWKTGPSPFQFGQYVELPFQLEDFPLKLSSLHGTLDLTGAKEASLFMLENSLSLDPVPLERLVRSFCLSQGRIPPATVRAQFPRIELTPGSVDLEGKVRAELFEGFAELDEMGLFDLETEVPEADFTLAFDGIRLDQLGDWLGFGEMDGILTGHAHEVTFQAALPTRFDARIEVKPMHRKKVVFSPDAMKNFVRLFADEGVDHLPGVVDWIAFGWPSRVFGGYDVYYAGAAVKSHDGFIEVRTLDKETQALGTHEELGPEKHFILRGRRFNMPLRSSRYPLIVDATSMGNYVHQMLARLGKLSGNRKKKEETPDDTDPSCEPPRF